MMLSFLQQIKAPLITVLTIFFGLFLYTSLVGPIPFSVNSVQTTKTDLFRVEGTGKATAVPDTALLSVGVSKTATTVAQAQRQANEVATALTTELKKLGIEDKNIKTVSYNIYPNYESGGANRASGYTVTQQFEVRIKPVDKVNDAIDKATAVGANSVGGVNFILDDEAKNKLMEEARADAINDAKTKAQSLAKLAGIRLGRIVDVQENANQPVMFADRAMGLGGAEAKPQAPTNVTPGENTITLTVSLSYQTF